MDKRPPAMEGNSTLSAEQIERIKLVAQLRPVRNGEILYEPSQRG